MGKSTFSAQLAYALAGKDKQVGLLDIDICGPSQPKMMGVEKEQVRAAPPPAGRGSATHSFIHRLDVFVCFWCRNAGHPDQLGVAARVPRGQPWRDIHRLPPQRDRPHARPASPPFIPCPIPSSSRSACTAASRVHFRRRSTTPPRLRFAIRGRATHSPSTLFSILRRAELLRGRDLARAQEEWDDQAVSQGAPSTAAFISFKSSRAPRTVRVSQSNDPTRGPEI